MSFLKAFFAVICLNSVVWAATTVPPSNSIQPGASPTAAQGQVSVEIDHIEKNTIYFKPNSPSIAPLKTGLFDVYVLGILVGENTPYVLFKAKPCESCNQEPALYAIKPNGSSPTTFVYPGRIVDGKSKGVVYESRAFFGKCLSGKMDDVYLVFQREKIDRKNRLAQSVFISEPTARFMNDRLLEKGLPRLTDTVRLVKSKRCHEIDGRNRMSARKPIDFKTPHGEDEDEDDADDNGASAPDGT